MRMTMEDDNIIQADVLEDQAGGWSLNIIPLNLAETFITEDELRKALATIEASR